MGGTDRLRLRAAATVLAAALLAPLALGADEPCRDAWQRAMFGGGPGAAPAGGEGAGSAELREALLPPETADLLLKEVAAVGLLVLPAELVEEVGGREAAGPVVPGLLPPGLAGRPAFVASKDLAPADLGRAYVLLSCDASDLGIKALEPYCDRWDYSERHAYRVPVCGSDLVVADYLTGPSASGDGDVENLCEYAVVDLGMVSRLPGSIIGGKETMDRSARILTDQSPIRRCAACEACRGKPAGCACPGGGGCDAAVCARTLAFDALRSVDALGTLRFLESRIETQVGTCGSMLGERRLGCLAEKAALLEDALARYALEAEYSLSATPLIRCRDEVRRALTDKGSCLECFDLALDCYENNLGQTIVRDRMSQEALGALEGALQEGLPWTVLARDGVWGLAGRAYSAASGPKEREGDLSRAMEEYRLRAEGISDFGATRKAQAESASRLFYGLYCMQSCTLRGTTTVGAGKGGWMLDAFGSADIAMARRLAGADDAAPVADIGVPLVLGPAFLREDGSLDEEALGQCPRSLLSRVALAPGPGPLVQRQGIGGLPWQVHVGARAYLACPHNRVKVTGDDPERLATLDAMGQLCETGPYSWNKQHCAFNGRLAVGGSEVDDWTNYVWWGATGYIFNSMHESSFRSRIVEVLTPDPGRVQEHVFGVVTSCAGPDREPLVATVAGGPVVKRDEALRPVLTENGAWQPLDSEGRPLPSGAPPDFYATEALRRAVPADSAVPVIAEAASGGATYPVVSRAVGPEVALLNPFFREFDPALMAAAIYRAEEDPVRGPDGGVCVHLYTGGYSRSARGDLAGHLVVFGGQLGSGLVTSAGRAGARMLGGEAGEKLLVSTAARASRLRFVRFNARFGRGVAGLPSAIGGRLSRLFGKGADRVAAAKAGAAAAAVARAAGDDATAAAAQRLTKGGAETVESALDKALLALEDASKDAGTREVQERLAEPYRRMSASALDGAPSFKLPSAQSLAGDIWEGGAVVKGEKGYLHLSEKALKHVEGMSERARNGLASRLGAKLGLETGEATALVAGKGIRHPKGFEAGLKALNTGVSQAIGESLVDDGVEAAEREVVESFGSGLGRAVEGGGGRAEFQLSREWFTSLDPDVQTLVLGRLGKKDAEAVSAAFRAGKPYGPNMAVDVSKFSSDIYEAMYQKAARGRPLALGHDPGIVKDIFRGMELNAAATRIADAKRVREATYGFLGEYLKHVDVPAAMSSRFTEELAARGGAEAGEAAVKEAGEAAERAVRSGMVGGVGGAAVATLRNEARTFLVNTYGISPVAADDLLDRAGLDNYVLEATVRVFSPERLQGGQPAARELFDAAIASVDRAQLAKAVSAIGAAAAADEAGLAARMAGAAELGLKRSLLHYSSWRGVYGAVMEKEDYGLDWTQPLFPYEADLWRLASTERGGGGGLRDRPQAGLPSAIADVCASKGGRVADESCRAGAEAGPCSEDWEPSPPDAELAALQGAAVRSPTPCVEGDPATECVEGRLRVLADGRCVPFFHESGASHLRFLADHLVARRALLARVRRELGALRRGLEGQCLACREGVARLGRYASCRTAGGGSGLLGDALAAIPQGAWEGRLADELGYAEAAGLCTELCAAWGGLDPSSCPLAARAASCGAEGSATAPGTGGLEAVPSVEGLAACVLDVLRAKRACTLLGLRAFTSNATRTGPPGAALGDGLHLAPGGLGSDSPCAALPRLEAMEGFIDGYLPYLESLARERSLLEQAELCAANAPYPDVDPCACVPLPEPEERGTEAYAKEHAAWAGRREACLAQDDPARTAQLLSAATRAEAGGLDLGRFALLLEQLAVAARGAGARGAEGLLAELYPTLEPTRSGGRLLPGLARDAARDISLRVDRQAPFMLSPGYEGGGLGAELRGECRCAGASSGCFADAWERARAVCLVRGLEGEGCAGEALRAALRDRPLEAASRAALGARGGISPGSCEMACGHPASGPNARGEFPPCVACPEGVAAFDLASCDAGNPYPFATEADRDAFLLNASYPAPVPLVCSLDASDGEGDARRRSRLAGPLAALASLDVRRLFPDAGCFDRSAGGDDPYAPKAQTCGDSCLMFRPPDGVPGSLWGYCRALVSADGSVSGECHCAWEDDPVGVPSGVACRPREGAAVHRAALERCREEHGCPAFTNAYGGIEGRFACLCVGGPVPIEPSQLDGQGVSRLAAERAVFTVEGAVAGPGGPSRAFEGERVEGCALVRNVGTGAFEGVARTSLVDGRGRLEGEPAEDELRLGPGESALVCTPSVAVSEAVLADGEDSRLAVRASARTGDREALPEAVVGEPLPVRRGAIGLDSLALGGDASEGETTVGASVRPVAAVRNPRSSPLSCTVRLSVEDERGAVLSGRTVELDGLPTGGRAELEGEGYVVGAEDVGKRLVARATASNEHGVPILDERGAERLRVAVPTLRVGSAAFHRGGSGLAAVSATTCDTVSAEVELSNPTTARFEGTVEVGVHQEGTGDVLAAARTRVDIPAGGRIELATRGLARPAPGTYGVSVRAVDDRGLAWRAVASAAARLQVQMAECAPGAGAPSVPPPGGAPWAPEEGPELPEPLEGPAWGSPEGAEGAQAPGAGGEAAERGAADVSCPPGPPSRRFDMTLCTGRACSTRRDGDGGSYLRIMGCLCPPGLVPEVEGSPGGSRLSERTVACCSPCEVARAG